MEKIKYNFNHIMEIIHRNYDDMKTYRRAMTFDEIAELEQKHFSWELDFYLSKAYLEQMHLHQVLPEHKDDRDKYIESAETEIEKFVNEIKFFNSRLINFKQIKNLDVQLDDFISGAVHRIQEIESGIWQNHPKFCKDLDKDIHKAYQELETLSTLIKNEPMDISAYKCLYKEWEKHLNTLRDQLDKIHLRVIHLYRNTTIVGMQKKEATKRPSEDSTSLESHSLLQKKQRFNHAQKKQHL